MVISWQIHDEFMTTESGITKLNCIYVSKDVEILSRASLGVGIMSESGRREAPRVD